MTSPSGGPIRMLQPSLLADHLSTLKKQAAAASVEDIAFDAEGIDKVITWINEIIDDKLETSKWEVIRASEHERPPGDYAGDWFVDNGKQFAGDYEFWANDYADKLRAFVKKLEALKKAYEAGEEEMAWGFDQGMQD